MIEELEEIEELEDGINILWMSPSLHRMKQFFLLSLLGLLTACSAALPKEENVPLNPPNGEQRSAMSNPRSEVPFDSAQGRRSPMSDPQYSNPQSPLPPFVSLSVPFSPQAPFANWDQLHEEACEEMSLLLVHHALTGTPLSREQAETELEALVQWEQANGYPMDVTVSELGEIAEQYFGYRFRVVEEPTEEDLKRLLAEGHLVIVPAAGRDLGNPYFSGEGPWYHMLVLTGYREFFFVTNDVGTRRGEGYVYRFDTLMNAIHDWTGVKEEIRTGQRRILIIDK